MTKLGMKRKTPKKRMKRSLKRDVLDKVFSDYIRLKADYTCEYCGKKNASKQGLHCSHFIGRTYKATRWLEDNCSCLCFGCHRHMEDFPAEYYDFMVKKLGSNRVEQLGIIARTKSKIDKPALTEYYKNKIKQLEKV